MTPDIFDAPPLSKEDSLLSDLYASTGRPLDDLPYTEEFDQLHGAFCRKYPGKSQRDVMERLFRLRKGGFLARKGQALSNAIAIDEGDVNLLENLVRKYAGTLGQRDRLPYTPEFDKVRDEFNRATAGKPLDAHALWRLIARIAK